MRSARAAEAEEIIAESQPGQMLEGEPQTDPGQKDGASASDPARSERSNDAVVLKIRRRKFHENPSTWRNDRDASAVPHRR